MNNKKLGTEFEKRICEKLSKKGYWVHFLTPDARGAQPFDIIAVKDGIAHACECKTLNDSARYFPLSRLEDNQIMAFDKWLACGNTEPIIAIEHHEEVYVVEYSTLKEKKKIDLKGAKKI